VTRSSAVAVLLVWLLRPPASSALPTTPQLAPCRVDGLEEEVHCGSFTVLEDRSRPDGRRLQLRLVVLPALGPRQPDPVVVLTGGPGQAASEGGAREARQLAALRSARDVVLLDQRGTGGSHPLRCTPSFPNAFGPYLGPPPPAAQIAACRDQLATDADLRRYTSLDAVDDLEELRAAEGWPTINLVAGSYGTRVALLYMAKHPDRVRTAALQGVSPPGSANPLPFARAGQRALDALLVACAADSSCARAFPALRDELVQVLARLERQPAEVTLDRPDTGEPGVVYLTRSIFVSRLHLMLLSGALSARVPALVHAAHGGNWRPFAELALAFGRAIHDQIYFGMQLSVMCSEDAPFLTPAAVAAGTAGTLQSSERVDQVLAFCAEWPWQRPPADFAAPVHVRVPTLVVAGELDPVTPIELAAGVAQALPLSRLVVLPQASHVDGGDCVDSLIAQLVVRGDALGVDPACVADLRRPPFVTHLD
jgi:pimeloyl-ACP methyl ester carboxylesterase